MGADVVFRNGEILTMDESYPYAEAIAIENEIIIKVGKNQEIDKIVRETTKIIDLAGRVVVPGFIDTHIHLSDFGRYLTWIDLKDITSIKEMQNKIRKRIQETNLGRWVIGNGWNQTDFVEKRFPTHSELDESSPTNPVILFHRCRSLCVVNSMALKLAGITEVTADPIGGQIDRDEETGKLTGILRDNAMNIVWNQIPEPDEEELLEGSKLACEKIVEAGVTSVHWMVSSFIELLAMKKLVEAVGIPLRINIIIPNSLLEDPQNVKFLKDLQDKFVRLGGVMIFIDGSLSAKTASLMEPYTSDPDETGELLSTQKEMNEVVSKVKKANLQLIMHAVGDHALDFALKSIESDSNRAIRKQRRYRLEQAAVLNPNLISRIKKEGIIISVQPLVIASEFLVWSATENLGPERARWLYPIRTLIKEGVCVIGGSDCPMEPLSPLLGIQAAVARGAFPQENLTNKEALRLYTVNAAYASFEESVKGTIKAGKLADLTILSRNLLKTPAEEIPDIQVEMTIVGGKIVYKNLIRNKTYHSN